MGDADVRWLRCTPKAYCPRSHILQLVPKYSLLSGNLNPRAGKAFGTNRALSRQRGLTLNARALPAVQLETVLIRMQFAVWVLGADRKSVV